MLEKKKEEIYHQNNQIYVEGNHENLRTRSQEVKDILENKRNIIAKHEKMVEDTDTGMFDRNTKYSAEQAQLKVELDNLQLADKELSQTVRPQLTNLKNEIKELNHSLVKDK